jgi:hypothetical protein
MQLNVSDLLTGNVTVSRSLAGNEKRDAIFCGDIFSGVVYIASGQRGPNPLKLLLANLSRFYTHQFNVRIVPCL